MATTASEDILTKVSTDAATEFVQSYYSALQANRAAIATFYSPTATTILFNGNPVNGGSAVQNIFVSQMPAAHYEVQSFDCQVINQHYPVSTTSDTKHPSRAAKNMSIVVVVSGFVKFGEGRDIPQRGFSETFTLVPNPAADAGKGKARKDWLIATQNFRLVV